MPVHRFVRLIEIDTLWWEKWVEDLIGGGRNFPGKIYFYKTEVFPRHLGPFSHEYSAFHNVPQLPDVPFPAMAHHRFPGFRGESAERSAEFPVEFEEKVRGDGDDIVPPLRK